MVNNKNRNSKGNNTTKHRRTSSKSRSNNKLQEPRLIVIFFVFIFIYVGAFAIKYMTKEKVDIHEVITGSISTNNTFTGIALRQEEVVNSELAGNINYFVREKQRVAVGSTVYTVDETGRVAAMIDSLNADDTSMSENNQSIIRNSISSYKKSTSNNTFYDIYDLSDKLFQVVSDSVNENIINNLDDMIRDTGSEDLFKFSKSPKSGIIVYNTDGFENKSVDQLTSNDFNRDNYQKTNLRAESIVVSGSPVYKLITSEDWEIAIPITNEQIQAQGLSEKKTIQIRFVKENITTNANFRIVPTSNGTYGVLSLNKFMILYASDRFVDIEIISSSASGLKIPVTSLVEKEFFTIPDKYGSNGGNKSTVGFVVEHQNSEGNVVKEYISANVYAYKDGLYYVDKNQFKFGDSIILADSNERYSISDVDVLKGVYTVNKGYAVFRRVEIIEQNAEYAICERGLSYGLSAYDHIVLDSTKVSENQIIY